MSTYDSVDGGHVFDGVRDVEVLRTKSLGRRAVLENMDLRFRRMEQRFDDQIYRSDTNRDRGIDRRRPRARDAYGGPINRSVAANRWVQISDESSDEEDEIHNNQKRQPRRRGKAYCGDSFQYRSRSNNFDDYYGGRNEYRMNNFELEVNLPYFRGDLGVRDFNDWIAEVEQLFEYMEIPTEKRVKLVACRLKGRASAWWERLQRKRSIEGKAPVRTWYMMKYLLEKEFLLPEYEEIMFQQYQRCHQGMESTHESNVESVTLVQKNDLREESDVFEESIEQQETPKANQDPVTMDVNGNGEASMAANKDCEIEVIELENNEREALELEEKGTMCNMGCHVEAADDKLQVLKSMPKANITPKRLVGETHSLEFEGLQKSMTHMEGLAVGVKSLRADTIPNPKLLWMFYCILARIHSCRFIFDPGGDLSTIEDENSGSSSLQAGENDGARKAYAGPRPPALKTYAAGVGC